MGSGLGRAWVGRGTVEGPQAVVCICSNRQNGPGRAFLVASLMCKREGSGVTDQNYNPQLTTTNQSTGRPVGGRRTGVVTLTIPMVKQGVKREVTGRPGLRQAGLGRMRQFKWLEGIFLILLLVLSFFKTPPP